MRSLRFRFATVRLTLVLVAIAAAAVAGRGQATAPNGNAFDPSQLKTRFPDKSVNMDSSDMTQAQHRLRLLNVARQKAMISDADKLLALARELNAGVDEKGVALTTGQRGRLAGEIEKLAHSVKDRMTNAIAEAPQPGDPFRPWQ